MSLSALFTTVTHKFKKNKFSSCRCLFNQPKFHKRHLSIPPRQSKRRLAASYTIEAAVLLPLFLMFAMTILYFVRVEYVQWRVGEAMTETVRTLSLYGEEVNEELVWTTFLADAKAKGVPFAMVKRNVLGFDFSNTTVEGSKINLYAEYQVEFPFVAFGKNGFRITQKRTGRIWNGYAPDSENEDTTYVYVTATGTAYHSTRYCPYINPSIRTISRSVITSQRNTSGAIYYRCPICGRKASNVYYITSWGNRYHSSTSCSGLKRTIRVISLSEAKEHYHPCPKCY